MTRLRRGATVAPLALTALLLVATGPTYADTDPGFGPDPSFDQGGPGIPGWFVGLAILAIVVGIAGTVWKVTTAQKIARQSGMDESLATQMSLLTDDGLEATYLASNLRPQVPPASDATAEPSTAARLAELKELLDQGLVTQAEYDDRRKAIIDSV
jgi:Short C-terminal domain